MRKSVESNKSGRTAQKRPMQQGRSTGNIFADLGFDRATAKHLLLRGQLAIDIEKEIRRRQWTQRHAAKVLGISQPRISELLSGQLDKFTIDTLVKYLEQLGLDVRIGVYPSDEVAAEAAPGVAEKLGEWQAAAAKPRKRQPSVQKSTGRTTRKQK